MEDAFLAGVKGAFRASNVNDDCVFSFTTKTTTVAGLSVAQCLVKYVSGNEYIRIDMLVDAFRGLGEITLIEYRGRGSTDAVQLLFEFKIKKLRHQVIYLLSEG